MAVKKRICYKDRLKTHDKATIKCIIEGRMNVEKYLKRKAGQTFFVALFITFSNSAHHTYSCIGTRRQVKLEVDGISSHKKTTVGHKKQFLYKSLSLKIKK